MEKIEVSQKLNDGTKLTKVFNKDIWERIKGLADNKWKFVKVVKPKVEKKEETKSEKK